jgi:hypothetical protein
VNESMYVAPGDRFPIDEHPFPVFDAKDWSFAWLRSLDSTVSSKESCRIYWRSIKVNLSGRFRRTNFGKACENGR